MRIRLLTAAALAANFGMMPARDAADQQTEDATAETNSADTAAATPTPPAVDMEAPEQVLITGAREQLLGTAKTSSQGIILKQELLELPSFRTGQLLETVPGLVVTVHSGEGKANQYLLRGFNLDHGTDLATFIDDTPVNMRTHAHGQGYTDLNFFIPELASGIDYTKGPYFSDEGDFASVGSVHIGYLNEIPDQMIATAGGDNYRRVFGAGTRELMSGHILGAIELVNYDGPWTHPDDLRKTNGVLRYSRGEATEGFSLTAMYYRGLWNATTDQPLRAMDPAYAASLGIAPIGRFGTLDPSDGGQAQRISLSGIYSHGTQDYHVDANGYVVNNQLTLWNNFTHFLDDPVNGDQHAQNEARLMFGGGASYTRYTSLLGANAEAVIGVQGRYDDNHVDLIHTKERVDLGVVEDDKVKESSGGIYAQLTDSWTEWFRSIIGVREDYFDGSDKGTNVGKVSQALFQPKGSLVFTPLDNWEFYASAGRGFHSDDVRGATQVNGAPLLAHSTGEEVGVRTTPLPHLTTTLTLFEITFQSELTYDADAGMTEAGRPSKRRGVELNATYEPFDWFEIYGSVAFTHARYTDIDPAGQYIPDAPAAIGQLAIYLRNIGPWSGGLDFRYLGKHSLIEDNSVTSKGDQEWNFNMGYDFGGGLKTTLGIFNLFNSKDDAADYYYADRITPTEPLSSPDGNPDIHIHPLEPRSLRITLSKIF